MLEYNKGIMLLRHDKREWLKGCTVDYRVDSEGNHAIQMLMVGEKREDSKESRSVWF